MVASRPAEARRRPSGLNATHWDHVGVPAEDEHLLAGRRVPDAHRLVLAGRGEAPAVGAERDAEDESVMPAEGAEALGRSSRPRPSRCPSKLAEARRRPSGLNASALTGSVMSAKGVEALARSPRPRSSRPHSSSPTRGAGRRG